MCVEENIGMLNDSYTDEELIQFLLQHSSGLQIGEVTVPCQLQQSFDSHSDERRNFFSPCNAISSVEPTYDELVRYLRSV